MNNYLKFLSINSDISKRYRCSTSNLANRDSLLHANPSRSEFCTKARAQTHTLAKPSTPKGGYLFTQSLTFHQTSRSYHLMHYKKGALVLIIRKVLTKNMYGWKTLTYWFDFYERKPTQKNCSELMNSHRAAAGRALRQSIPRSPQVSLPQGERLSATLLLAVFEARLLVPGWSPLVLGAANQIGAADDSSIGKVLSNQYSLFSIELFQNSSLLSRAL